MKIIILTFVLTVLGKSFGQVGSETFSIKELKDEWFLNGQKKIELGSMDSNRYFKYTEWRENGQKRIEGVYLNDGKYNFRHGLWTNWYKNGVIRSQIIYKYDYKVGECIYYKDDGSIDKIINETFIPSVPFYDSESYLLGNKNPANHFPEDGHWEYNGSFTRIKAHYKDWERDGLYTERSSDNNKLILQGNYKNGNKVGIWTRYHQDSKLYDASTGIPYKTTEYKNGKINGWVKKYYFTGEIQEEGYQFEDKKYGRWLYYDKNGETVDTFDFTSMETGSDPSYVQNLIDRPDNGVVIIPEGIHYIDGPLILKNKNKFHLKAIESASIISRDKDSYVLIIENSSNLKIENLLLSHLVPSETFRCKGGEVSITRSEQIHIHNCELFGSGSYGAKVRRSNYVTIKNCIIRDNHISGVFIWDCMNIQLSGNKFQRNGRSSEDYLILKGTRNNDISMKKNIIIDIPSRKYFY